MSTVLVVAIPLMLMAALGYIMAQCNAIQLMDQQAERLEKAVEETAREVGRMYELIQIADREIKLMEAELEEERNRPKSRWIHPN